MNISDESPDKLDVVRMIVELDTYQKALCPPESHHGLNIAELLSANMIFLVARSQRRFDKGEPMGCGGVEFYREQGTEFVSELKRMYTVPQFTRQGVAAAILRALEIRAMHRHSRVMRLETGVRQHAAIKFYEKQGYVERGPFHRYLEDPHSVFMEKKLV